MSRRPVTAVHVRAPGKVNVGLSVGPLQPDGYHDLATIFQAVSLFEEIYAHSAREFSVSFTGPIQSSELVGTDTLVHRAARLVAAELSEQQLTELGESNDGLPGLRIVVEKHVPIAGGMGGGSADAAATLLACNALWNVGLDKPRLWELAATLGADVPFALQGGTALGLGRGDQLTPVLTGGQFSWVLVQSQFGLSTPAVYAELDQLRERRDVPSRERAAISAELLSALRQGDSKALEASLMNDLQAAAFSLSPDLEALARTIRLRPAAGVTIVSGSGPTLAILASDRHHAESLARELCLDGFTATAVVGPVPGAHFVNDVPGATV